MGSTIAAKSKSLPPGIYPPVISLYKSTIRQEIDLDASYKFFTHLIRGGVHGLVLAGTNAEAVLLSAEERKELVKVAKKAASDLGRPELPVVAGISGQSTNESIRLAEDALSAGADFGLLLPPNYWAKAVTKDVILGFYHDVADATALPIVLYSVSCRALFQIVRLCANHRLVSCYVQRHRYEFRHIIRARPTPKYCRCEIDLWKCWKSNKTHTRV
jgi:2-keto-3-deoxy-L-rhamnonate aldolase